MKLSGNTILVTGGGSGIGRALAREFHRLGNRVIVAGRREATLDETIAGYPGMTKLRLDIGDKQSIADCAAAIATAHPDLNVLMNNAGIMRLENPAEPKGDPADAEATIATNLLGPIRLTAALLPQLRRQPRSAIINVTSALAFVPLVATPTYCATKAALHSYTISLRHRLRSTTTEVIELIPPGVQTDLLPGHADNPLMMPLRDFIAETMALFEAQPTREEICVKRVALQRRAEAEGRFDAVLATLNSAPRPSSPADERVLTRT
jgi:uncharacterized oxidoreductase